MDRIIDCPGSVLHGVIGTFAGACACCHDHSRVKVDGIYTPVIFGNAQLLTPSDFWG